MPPQILGVKPTPLEGSVMNRLWNWWANAPTSERVLYATILIGWALLQLEIWFLWKPHH